jgi:putative ABC transport system permease protein
MKLIDFLIRLYPEEFRARYARQLQEFHADRMDERGSSLAPVVTDHVTSAFTLRMQTLLQDVHYALRGLARRPAFAAVVLATIALGVGANAAIFSVVNGILFRPLPYPDAGQLVTFGHKAPFWLLCQRDFVEYKRDVASLASLSVYTQSEGTLTGVDEPERIPVVSATRDFLGAMGVAPAIGRFFGEDEDRARPATVAIISHRLWQRRFGGDTSVVGSKIQLNGVSRTIVGVMPPHFDYPSNRTDMWLPMPRFNMDSLEQRGNYYLFAVGRLKPGRTVERAEQEAITVARRMIQDNPLAFDPRNPLTPVLKPVREQLLGQTRPYLWAMLGAVGFVLLIVCVNVANLLLARGEGRRKEIAVRTALGASRSRIATQLLTECFVLALAGGALGLAVAWALQRALVAVAPASIPRVDQIGVDWTMVVYTFAIALLAGLFFGLAPAFRGAREAPAATLKEGGKTMSHGGSRRLRRALVVADVALAVVMLSGAGMLVRSLMNLQSAGMGFDTDNVLTVRVSPPVDGYSVERSTVFYDELLRRIRGIPGVQSAGAARWLPVADAGGLWGVMADGKSYPPSQWPSAVPQQVTTGFFKAMGMPIVAGRDFTEDDRAGGPYSVIISRKAAQLLWPEMKDALGQRMRTGGQPYQPLMTVVGIVDDIRQRGFHDTPEPTMYVPYPQTHQTAYFMPRPMALVIRTTGDPLLVTKQVRAAVRALDPIIPVSDVRTLEQVVGTSVANRRFSTGLIAAFAVLALLLAGIGIFGVISYGVSERTFEIGVRMALGAERSSVLALIVGDGVRMALIGLAAGLLGAYGVARAIESMLVGVPSVDLPTLAMVSVVLTLVAIGASLIPARRAMAVSPTEALRGS